MCCRRLLRLLVGTILVGISLLYPQVAAADHQRPCPPDRPLDLPIAYGDIIDPCEVNPSPDIHFYRFTGLEGDLAIVQLTKLSGAGVACMRVLLGDRVIRDRECTAFGFAPVRHEIPLDETGTYTVRVDERNFNATFVYRLYLNLPPSPTEVRFRETRRETLRHAEDIDLYFFTLDHNQGLCP